MKVGVFVDLSNLFYCCSRKFDGRKLDYNKYLEAIRQNYGEIVRATAFGAQKDSEAQGFITCLKHIGFEVKYKQPRVFTVGSKTIQRIDWNVGIALDVVRTLDRLDVVVIGSSDPELAQLAAYIRECGITCIVLSCGINKELKKAATQWLEIPEEMLE